MQDIHESGFSIFLKKIVVPCAFVFVLIAIFDWCRPLVISGPPKNVNAPATPDPRAEALIERNIKEHLARENWITEQQLVNARDAASQRRIGVQMFLDLEEQYRQRAEKLAAAGQTTPNPSPAQEMPPSATK